MKLNKGRETEGEEGKKRERSNNVGKRRGAIMKMVEKLEEEK